MLVLLDVSVGLAAQLSSLEMVEQCRHFLSIEVLKHPEIQEKACLDFVEAQQAHKAMKSKKS